VDIVCVPACEGKECGPDGCTGTCGKCPDGFECLDGFCEEAGPCEASVALKCVGDLLYWFDAAGNQCALEKQCVGKCVVDHCEGDVGPENDFPDAAVEVTGDAIGSDAAASPDGTITFDTPGSKSGGCSHGQRPTAAGALLLTLLLALLRSRSLIKGSERS